MGDLASVVDIVAVVVEGQAVVQVVAQAEVQAEVVAGVLVGDDIDTSYVAINIK